MRYRVEIARRAEKRMRDMTQVMRRRVRNRIVALQDDPYKGASKLVATPGFRVRVGDYRILYQVDDEERLVRVTSIGHRREAYR